MATTRTRSTRTKATAPATSEAEVDKVDETAAAVEQTEVTTPEGDGGQAPEAEANNDGEAKDEGEAKVKAPKARAGKKLVWTNTTDKNENGECEGTGKRNGNVYQILQNEDGTFNGLHFVEDAEGNRVGDITVVAENVTGHVAWRKCVDHHNVNYIAPAVEETETPEGETGEAGTEVATTEQEKVEAAS